MIGVAQLRALASLERFTDAELEVLVGVATVRTARVGEVVMREGEPGRSCMILVSGQLDVIKRVGDRDRQLAALPPGTLLGQVALIDHAPRTATVCARTPAVLLELGRDVFDKLLGAQSPLALRFQEQIAVAGARQLRSSTTALARIIEATEASPALRPVDALESLRVALDEWGMPVEIDPPMASRRP